MPVVLFRLNIIFVGQNLQTYLLMDDLIPQPPVYLPRSARHQKTIIGRHTIDTIVGRLENVGGEFRVLGCIYGQRVRDVVDGDPAETVTSHQVVATW